MHSLDFNSALEYLKSHPDQVTIKPSPEFFIRSDVRGAILQALNDAQIPLPYPVGVLDKYIAKQAAHIEYVRLHQNDYLPAFRDLVTLQLATFQYALSLGNQV